MLRKVVDTAQTRRDLLYPHLLKLRRLVKEDNVILGTLILVEVLVVVAVAEFDGAAVREGKYLLRLVVASKSVQLLAKLIDMVVKQLGISATHDQYFDPPVARREYLRLGAHRPRFTAATRPAKADVLLRRR